MYGNQRERSYWCKMRLGKGLKTNAHSNDWSIKRDFSLKTVKTLWQTR